MRKSKSLHHIVINGCKFNTILRYNINTNYIEIYTNYQYTKDEMKIYYKNNKNKILNKAKIYYKNNKDKMKKYYEDNKDEMKDYQKEHYENNRDPNTPRMGSLEFGIKVSCGMQGIPIKDFDGFISDQPYCKKFNNQLKNKIRNQYNNCDYISGIHKSICNTNRELDIHHINYNKQCGCNGNRCKLIPLSTQNHLQTNGNRPFWNRLFIYSLKIDRWYYE